MVLDERHLDVELGELRLAVGPQVFIAEAAGNLEIAVEAGNHEKLLVKLGRLGQRIEMSGMDPAGNQEIPRAFRRTASQDGRLDLQEVEVAHDVAHQLG